MVSIVSVSCNPDLIKKIDAVTRNRSRFIVDAIIEKLERENNIQLVENIREQYRKTVIIPALKNFVESEFLSIIYNRPSLQDKFMKEYPEVETSREEIDRCVLLNQKEDS
jgi:site-specific DNA-adenine methylase